MSPAPAPRGIEGDGFSIERSALVDDERRALLDALGPAPAAGRRGLLELPLVATTARSARLVDLARPHVGGEPSPVRAIYFDKPPGANWLVPWHQDLTIAVRSRAEVPGFGPWSTKGGVPHVQPPVELLGRMLTIRLHLDDADEGNGALRVLPGTHKLGRLAPGQIAELRARGDEVSCAARAGDALLMRPLLLHASGRSSSPGHRRVLHVEYAAFPLPGGLSWAESASVDRTDSA